jgi:TRAP-type C4-dicarboxylate transport system permease small subunit
LTDLFVEAGGSRTPRLLRPLRRAAELVSAALFAMMFTAFMIQIISRYVFNSPVSWSLELCSITYVWVVFWTCGILVSERKHIVFDVLYNKFPPPRRRRLAMAITGSLTLAFFAALPGTFDYIHFMGRRHSMLLHVPMILVYACFGIFLVATIVGGALRLRRLAGPDWQSHL